MTEQERQDIRQDMLTILQLNDAIEYSRGLRNKLIDRITAEHYNGDSAAMNLSYIKLMQQIKKEEGG